MCKERFSGRISYELIECKTSRVTHRLTLSSLDKLQFEPSTFSVQRLTSIHSRLFVLSTSAKQLRQLHLLSEPHNRPSQNMNVSNELFKRLIDLLEDYEDLNITIPGISKNINDLILILKKRSEKHNLLRIKIENIKKTQDLLEKISLERKEFLKDFLIDYREACKHVDEDKDADSIIADLNRQKIAWLVNEKDRIKIKIDKLKRMLINLDINPDLNDIDLILESVRNDERIKTYHYLEEEQLYKKIEELSEDSNRLNESIKKNNFIIEDTQKEIDNLEKMTVHEHWKQLDYINELFTKTQKLSQRIRNEFEKNLNALINNGINIADLNSEQTVYFNKIGIYLAKRLKNIPYADIVYELKNVDLIKNKIITTSGDELSFSFFSTGQAQSAYLKGLIESTEGKKLIVLFDEVGSMDSNSMKPVIDRMNELYHQGDLLLGIIAQKNNTQIKITSLID